jgi:hypothetical protein
MGEKNVDNIIFEWALAFLKEVLSLSIVSLKTASDVVNTTLYSYQKIEVVFQLAYTDYSYKIDGNICFFCGYFPLIMPYWLVYVIHWLRIDFLTPFVCNLSK